MNDVPLLPLSFDRFPPNFPWTRIPMVARDTWFHILEKFPLRDRISRKTVFFRVQKGILIVPSLRVTGNVQRRLDCFHPLAWTSHRFILPRWLLLRDVPFSSYPRPTVLLCHGLSNGETWMHTLVSIIFARGNDRIADFALVHLTWLSMYCAKCNVNTNIIQYLSTSYLLFIT